MTRLLQLLLLLSVAGLCVAQNAQIRKGKNAIPVRGVQQDVYYIPGSSTDAERPCILFLPGDGGWRGFAITMAEQMAGWGYDVYGLDTKSYLSSFTGKTTLKEEEVIRDIRTVADAVRGKRRVVLMGWSAGVGLVALAASAPSKDAYVGLVAVSLGDTNILGWKFADNLTYLTGKLPDEPTFSALAYMSRIAPLPLAMMQSAEDEYIPRDEANRLFGAAAEPKRFLLVPAKNHRFDGAQPEFFRQLQQAVEWTIASEPKP